MTLGAGNATIWVDGQEAGSSSSISIKPSDIRPVLNYIGRSQYDADPLFSGLIDDIRIYNYPLTAQELQSIVTNPTAINKPECTGKQENTAPVYRLDGQRATDHDHGVMVSKGKKWMKK